jgi:hypothetical protein
MTIHGPSRRSWCPTGLEITEVTTCVSLSTGTSSPTERISRLYETPKCQTWGLNFLQTTWKVYICTKVVGKRSFSMSRVKTKFQGPNITIHRFFFVFLHMQHKMFFSSKISSANIDCPNIHAKFPFKILWNFDFFIIGLYVAMSQNTTLT